MKASAIALVALVAFWANSALGTESVWQSSGKAQARIVTPVQGITPGVPFEVGVEIKLPEGWHTYWRNPGDSGEPVQLAWQGDGLETLSEIAWPVPTRIPYGPLMNLGYKNELLLTQRVTADPASSQQSMVIQVDGRWLVCEEVCIPEEAQLTLTLPIVDRQEIDPQIQARFDRQPIPQLLTSGYEVTWQDPDALSISLSFPGIAEDRFETLYYLPYEPDVIDLGASPSVSYHDSGLTLVVTVDDLTRSGYDGLIWYQEEIQGQILSSAFEIQVPAPMATATLTGWLKVMLFAFLGGLLLNIMPCVFPVLSIKVLALLEESAGSVSMQRKQGWWYTAGVVFSFVAIAAALMLLRSLGEQIGWGFQLQNPVIVTLLTLLFLGLGLNLSGFYDFTIAVSAPAASGSGARNAFTGGVLAVLVAAPCTAPFMGAALGFALTQSAIEGLIVFVGLGFGMALPFLLLAYSPGALGLLPRPGPWMTYFKEGCAFLMYATSIWLSWLLIQQVGSAGWLWLASAGLLLVIFLWTLQRFGATSWWRKVLLGFLLLGMTAAIAKIGDQKPVKGDEVAGATRIEGRAQEYRPEAVRAAIQQGPVFVNFTADWCITCKVNEAVAIKTANTEALFEAQRVTYFKADWTNEDPMITAALGRFGRVGVPLYLIYQQGSSEPSVLPQILTENMIAQALNAPGQGN
ncbi:MAG: protein-disulfide reductase DsbD family protein [Proteobacteria bacterium]|nr:protein-disulfide reductase DsbD family protein [Pseudomonadota bacterium]